MLMDERTFFIVWLVGIVLIWPPSLWFVVRSRRKRGEPIVPRCPPAAMFCERRGSGRARGWIGGASNCLLVAVTDRELWIAPTFPFNMVSPYGVFGLDHRVPKARVVRAEPMRAIFGENVFLELPGRAGRRNAEVRLKLRDPEAFLAALRG
ncbi:MAG: hypothetical protein KY446_10240 [Proteobacteria bacterium]|nr:hypothetical protein [Pseudomonadota bacterium]MBW3618106.1 hypothetical protein [Pseudomonadota bacterium]